MVWCVEVPYLVVQRQKVHAARDGLATLRAEADDFEAGLVQLFGQLVDGDVGGRTHEHLALVLPREVVDDGGTGDGLAGARRSLDEVQWALHGLAHGVDLRVVQLRQVRRSEVPGQVCPEGLRLHVVAEQSVVEVSRHAGIIDRESAQGRLHAVERRGLPHELHGKAVLYVPRPDVLRATQLERHLFVGRDLGDVPHGAPAGVLRVAEGRVGRGVQPQPELVAGHQPGLVVLLGEVEVRDALLVEADVPAHDDVLLRLRLLHSFVVVCLHLDQRREHVLVLVGILVAQHDGLRVVLESGAGLALEVLQGRFAIRLPELLQLVHLSCRDVP
mmetsp:Transcript_11254/g.30094  ORF Transcript_11254/g.30094 Transcript_11254/m.30094 type:complete len:330 (+) Transcript_11254:1957-2946(+)